MSLYSLGLVVAGPKFGVIPEQGIVVKDGRIFKSANLVTVDDFGGLEDNQVDLCSVEEGGFG